MLLHVLFYGWVLFQCVCVRVCVCVCVGHIFFIQSSVDGHLDCFHVLAVVNSASVNIGVQVYFWIIVFSECMPRNGITGSCGNPVFRFFVCFFYFLFFHCVHSLQKFPGQESNTHHSSGLSYCSDNTAALTCCTMRELPPNSFLAMYCLIV